MDYDVYAACIAVCLPKLYWRYVCKKKAENLDVPRGYEDWEERVQLLRKELGLWIFMVIVYTAFLAWHLVSGLRPWISIGILTVLAYQFVKTMKAYYVANRRVRAASKEEFLQKVKDFLAGCRITELDSTVGVEEAMRLWLAAREKGKKEGFCPVLLDVDQYWFDSFDEQSYYTDRSKYRWWRSEVLQPDNLPDAKEIFHKRLEAMKGEYDSEEEWGEDIVGTYEGYDEPCLDLVGDTVWLAEIPVEHPWQVFAYIPTRLGDAEDCLHATEHMAIAKHWYENYGAEILRLNSEQIDFYLPQPVTGHTDQLAVEHYVYAGNGMEPDYNCVLHDYLGLATLVVALKKITIWNFW